MKKLLSFTFIFASLMVAQVLATDVPQGGDAFFHQMRNSNTVVLATLKSIDAERLTFVLNKSFLGAIDSQFILPNFKKELSNGINPKVGGSYLLFLRQRRIIGRGAAIGFAMGGYSIQEVRPMDADALSDVVADYIRYRSDLKGLKQSLMAHSQKNIPFIQYSAISDLDTHGLLAAEDTRVLAQRLNAGQITDARAKFTVVNRIKHFNLKEFSPVLEKLILNSNENISVRTASLHGLEQFGDQAALARVAPAMVDGVSGRLRRTTIDIVKPR